MDCSECIIYKPGMLHKNINDMFVSQSYKDGSVVGRNVDNLLLRDVEWSRHWFAVEFLSCLLFSQGKNTKMIQRWWGRSCWPCTWSWLFVQMGSCWCLSCLCGVWRCCPALCFVVKLTDRHIALRFGFVFIQVAKMLKMPKPCSNPFVNVVSLLIYNNIIILRLAQWENGFDFETEIHLCNPMG